MKVVVVGNLAKRTELKGKKKITILAGGSYFAAVQAARLGHDVTLITKISSKFPKKWIKKIEKENIKIIKQPSWEDTAYTIKYNKDNTREVTVESEAGPIMRVPKIDCDIALISSYIGYININVLKILKTEDNLVVLDSQGFTKYKNSNGTLSYVPWLEKEEYLKYVDILKLNMAELYYLTGKTTIHSAYKLLKLGPKIVTLTLKDKGAYIFSGKRYIKVPVFQSKKFINKSGVGDVYTAALAIKYRETENITDAAYFSAAAASYCVEGIGAEKIGDLKKINKRFKTLKDIFLV